MRSDPGFNGDWHIRRKIEELVAKYKIALAIETGTNRGDTAAALAELVPRVRTVDIDAARLKFARRRLAQVRNVETYQGNSAEMLMEMVSGIEEPTLFYLDAHWRTEWPLLGELRAIAASRVSCAVIAIHDFKVPGLGFDSYGGRDLDLEYVSKDIGEIFPSGYVVETNSRELAAGARRGIAYFHAERVFPSGTDERTCA